MPAPPPSEAPAISRTIIFYYETPRFQSHAKNTPEKTAVVLAAVIAVHKVGAAYVPVDPEYPEGRAYMIYTSGSTGKPKIVVQSHRSLRALVAWMLDKFDIAEESVYAESQS